MKMLLKKVGEPAQVVDLPGGYETIKTAVDGFIEPVRMDKGVICWINEEGKLIGLPLNFYLGNVSIFGNALFMGETRGGNSKALTDDQIAYVMEFFKEKASAYQKWIDTYFAEKALDIEVWTYTNEKAGCNYICQIDNYSVIAQLRGVTDKGKQNDIRKQLVLLDFSNQNVNEYLEFIAKQIAQAKMKEQEKIFEDV